MYCGAVALGATGAGRAGSPRPARPLPLRTRTRLPVRVERDARRVPAGRDEARKRLSPGRVTSTTATVLLSALATSRVAPSGDSASAFGVEPGGACRREGDADALGGVRRREVHHPHRVRVGAGDEERARRPSRTPSRSGARRRDDLGERPSGCAARGRPRARRPTRSRRRHSRRGPRPRRSPRRRGRARASTCPSRRPRPRPPRRRPRPRRAAARRERARGRRRSRRLSTSSPCGRLLGRGRAERAAGHEALAAPLDLADRVVGRARREETLAVGVPGDPEPRVVERHLLGHLPAVDVHHAQARLRPAVVRDHEVAAVGVQGHRERQVARVEVAARGGDAPAVRQERHALALRAGVCWAFGGGLTETEERCQSEERGEGGDDGAGMGFEGGSPESIGFATIPPREPDRGVNTRTP